MVADIKIYIEGGGGGRVNKSLLRQGFGNFFKKLKENAQHHKIGWDIISCGPRNKAYDVFEIACRKNKESFNVLLVDSEGPVIKEPKEHLRDMDGWKTVGQEEQYHLMAQMMEAWFVADVDALKEFYGRAFQESAFSNQQDVEQINKDALLRSLNQATRHTQKGTYHKIRHGSDLLGRINPQKVCERAKHCKRLFETLENIISE